MAGDGHMGNIKLLNQAPQKPAPKRIEHIDQDISQYVETKSREQLKREHGPHGGYVLYDHEYE